MIGNCHRIEFKKAGLSGLFHRTAITATFLVALSSAAVTEPLTIELTIVEPGLDQRTKQPLISFKMTPQSTRLFAELTTKNVGRKMEVRIDGKTVMAPVIREPILGGSGQVTSDWTLRETKDIADRLSAGKSKIEFEIVDE